MTILNDLRYVLGTFFMSYNVCWVIPALVVGAVCIIRLINNRYIGAVIFSIYVYASLFFIHGSFYT